MRPSAERPLLPANRELMRGLGVVAAFVLVAYLVILARHALLEVFLAVGLAVILEPLVRVLQQRLHLRRGFAAAIAVGGVVAAMTAIVALLVAPFYAKTHDMIQGLPGVAHQLRENGRLGDPDDGKEVSQDGVEDAAKWLVADLPEAVEVAARRRRRAALGTGSTASTIMSMASFLLLEGARTSAGAACTSTPMCRYGGQARRR